MITIMTVVFLKASPVRFVVALVVVLIVLNLEVQFLKVLRVFSLLVIGLLHLECILIFPFEVVVELALLLC